MKTSMKLSISDHPDLVSRWKSELVKYLTFVLSARSKPQSVIKTFPLRIILAYSYTESLSEHSITICLKESLGFYSAVQALRGKILFYNV